MALKSKVEFEGRFDGGGTLDGTLRAIQQAFAEAVEAGAPEKPWMIHIGVHDPTVYVTVSWHPEARSPTDGEVSEHG